MSSWSAELPLVGGGGEPVDLRRTIRSHGVVDLPPMRPDEDGRALEITLSVARARPRTLRVSERRPGRALVEGVGPAPPERAQRALLDAVRHVLRLDEDLSPFYALAAEDPELAWATAGAGRMVRSPTVFEDVVKTICTTNCAWSATERMVSALVEHLGAAAPGGAHAFPTPEAMGRPARTSTTTSSGPATAAATSTRSPDRSPTAPSISRFSAVPARTSSPRTSSQPGCWRCPASGPTRPRT